MSANDASHVALLSFRLGEQGFALRVADVVEVAAMVALQRIPDAPPAVLGMANRHGSPLPIVDLRRAFGFQEAVINEQTLFIVAHVGEPLVGLVVDEVYPARLLPATALTPAQGVGETVTHLVRDGERLLQLLNPAALYALYAPHREDDEATGVDFHSTSGTK